MQQRGSAAVTAISITVLIILALGSGILIASQTKKAPTPSSQNQEEANTVMNQSETSDSNLAACPEPYIQMVDTGKSIAGVPIQEAVMGCVVGSFSPTEAIAAEKDISGEPVEIVGRLTYVAATDILKTPPKKALKYAMPDIFIPVFETEQGIIGVFGVISPDERIPVMVRIRGLYARLIGNPLTGTLHVPMFCPTCVELSTK
jgi:hypothetical protein